MRTKGIHMGKDGKAGKLPGQVESCALSNVKQFPELLLTVNILCNSLAS